MKGDGEPMVAVWSHEFGGKRLKRRLTPAPVGVGLGWWLGWFWNGVADDEDGDKYDDENGYEEDEDVVNLKYCFFN